VRLLLDTHVVLWWLAGSPKLGGAARRLIGGADCAVSTASLVELRTKVARGKLRLPGIPEFVALLDAEGFQVLAVTPAHVESGTRFELSVADAVDRLLLGTAEVEGRELLTRDAALLALASEAKLRFVRAG